MEEYGIEYDHRFIPKEGNLRKLALSIQEAKDMEKELVTLKGHISTHKRLVKELVDGIYLEAVSDEMKESVVDESEFDEPNELEAHIGSVSDTLDVLLSENKMDEAIEILLVEEQIYRNCSLMRTFHRID